MTRHHKYLPGLEQFEVRLTPAGNVTASLGDVLAIRGDAAANRIRITQDGNLIRINSIDGTTKINGQTSVTFNSPALEKTDIRLFGGDDVLEIKHLRTSVDQYVEMGLGNDTVTLDAVRAGVNLTVKADHGFDRVNAVGVVTRGDFYVDTGGGPSSVTISGTTVGKSLTVIGGEASDRVAISGTTTREDLNVESKEGDDRVDLVNVRSSKNIKVDTDAGNDYVAVRNVYAAYDAVFLGEDGLDTFENRGVRAGQKLEIKGFDRFV